MSRQRLSLVGLLLVALGLAIALRRNDSTTALDSKETLPVIKQATPAETSHLMGPRSLLAERTGMRIPVTKPKSNDALGVRAEEPAEWVIWAQIVDRDGQPFQNLPLEFVPPRGARDALPFQVVTDQSGRFEAKWVAPEGDWRMFANLDDDLGVDDFSSPRGQKVSPVLKGEGPSKVVLGHGLRIFVSVQPPPGLGARDLMVELLANPSFLSSQIGGLGGLTPLREDERGFWAWAAEITNRVRGNGGRVRLVSRDGLWASAWQMIEFLDENGEPRPIGNSDEFHIQVVLTPRAVIHVKASDGAQLPFLLLSRGMEPNFSERVLPSELRTGTEFRYSYRWIEPGEWNLPNHVTPQNARKLRIGADGESLHEPSGLNPGRLTAVGGQVTGITVHDQRK